MRRLLTLGMCLLLLLDLRRRLLILLRLTLELLIISPGLMVGLLDHVGERLGC